MKKNILVAFAVLTFGFTNAQKARFGVKGGLNVANMNYSGSEVSPDFKTYIGFHIGGFVDFKISDKFSIQPELIYSAQGSKYDVSVFVDENEYNTKNTFKLGYINIPVMFKYYVAEKFNLEAGPQIGFLTSSKINTKVIGKSVTQDAKEIFNSTDFGFNLGAGYDFTDAFSANIRYNFGLANIAETESGDDSKIKNNVFSVSIGYKFK